MDTTLMTFHLRTSSYTQTVHLVGSWDNFTKHYPMEQDIRRSANQWRGCYKFEDIICDGEPGALSKRTGGLKMGSTYYYYYELDDGTEIHDTSLPFTTNCPYMPGQPMNLLSVPVEVHPLRCRSASLSSMAVDDKMTMNPADKFMAPRPPPPRPFMVRLKTAPAPRTLIKKRSTRSLSPKPDTARSQWSTKSFFGLRSSAPSAQELGKRGRSNSETTPAVPEQINYAALGGRIDSEENMRSYSHPRETSPALLWKTCSRDPSPLRRFASPEPNNFATTILTIPDEIEEDDDEDDANFADHLHRLSLLDRSILTPLAPTPSAKRFPHRTSGTSTPATNFSKPLPLLPEDLELALTSSPSSSSRPASRRSSPRAAEAHLPRSHFSTSTISTTMTSPTYSHLSYSECDEDLSLDNGSGDDSTYSPIVEEAEKGSPFLGYSLPEENFMSSGTLGKVASREGSVEEEARSLTAFQELMVEMGYLGDLVRDK